MPTEDNSNYSLKSITYTYEDEQKDNKPPISVPLDEVAIYHWAPLSLLKGALSHGLNCLDATTATVKNIVKKVQNSELSLIDTLKTGSSLLFDAKNRAALYAIGQEYQSYKALVARGQKSHHYLPSIDEKQLMYLHQKGAKRTLKETKDYHQLLIAADEIHQSQKQQEFKRAAFLVETMESIELPTRQHVQSTVTELWCHTQGTTQDKLTLEEYSAIELAVSKILLKYNDECLKQRSEDRQIGILIPVHKEHNRLQKKSDRMTGEDFLYNKLEQLDFLFKGITNIHWHVTFVDDQPTSTRGPEGKTIDAIKRCIENDERLGPYTDKVTCLDYEDLEDEIRAYAHPTLKEETANSLANKSVKGAAVHLGLRYLARVTEKTRESLYLSPKADILYVTDADLSINLAGIGLELHEVMNGDRHLVIGSRRIEHSHVYGRTTLREMQSFLFNQLVRGLLNIQVSDTQVGAKAFSAELISDIHSDFCEISMAFDPEIIRLMKEYSFDGKKKKYHLGTALCETGRVWRDSSMESQSTGQSMNMFSGLHTISEHLVQRKLKASEDSSLLHQLMAEGECFDSLMELATDPKFQLLVEHFNELYLALAPKELRALMNDSKRLVIALACNDPTSNQLIQRLLDDIQSFLEKIEASDYLGFLLHLFPQVYSLGELLQRDPNYLKIILPLLLGDDNPLSLLVTLGHPSYRKTLKELGQGLEPVQERDLHSQHLRLFDHWLKSKRPQVSSKARIFHPMSPEKLVNYQQKLAKINSSLVEKDQLLKIGIVLNYTMDSTPRDYIDRIIKGKVQALQEAYGQYRQIQFHLIIIDTRPQNKCKSGIDEYINNILADINSKKTNVTGIQIYENPPDGTEISKARAVKIGMNVGLSEGCSQVGYIDFSDKIHIEEIGGLVSQVYDKKIDGYESVAIGSRRMEGTELENKPVIPLLQSSALNLFVKSMFPRLFHLSDTQTGFKLFSADAWRKIQNMQPMDESMGFDVELLQIAAKLDFPIEECPVDFYDARQNESEIRTTQQVSIFQGLIDIRGRLDDLSYQPLGKGDTRLLGCGAENMVFTLDNGSIIKIPHEALGDDFFTILKQVIFKNRAQMSMDSQANTLETANFINKLMQAHVIKRNIAALRNWKELNAFVMRMISAVENKSYKAIGYQTSLRFGKDLIVPFRMINYPVKLTLFGVSRFIEADAGLKQSVAVHETFGSRFYVYLGNRNLVAIEALFDEGIQLFQALWKRGLFDLDTNFMRDTGFYRNAQGEEQLMCLDPGEMIDNLLLIDVEASLKKIIERADFQEIKAAIETSDLVVDDKRYILDAYVNKLQDFFKTIVLNDIQLAKAHLPSNVFGKERNDQPNEDFAILFPDSLELEMALEQDEDRQEKIKREAFRTSKVGFQKPYRDALSPQRAIAPARVTVPFLHTLPSNNEQQLRNFVCPNEVVQPSGVGSIIPLFQAIKPRHPLVIVLDSGTATRSSLLKYATPDKTKGQVVVANTPLYVYAAQAGAQIYTHLRHNNKEDYVVLMSSDDYLELNEQILADIERYFKKPSSPALYWTDLPNAGKDYFPMTYEETYQFLLNNQKEFTNLLQNFALGVPFLQGFSTNQIIVMVVDAIFNTVTHHKTFEQRGRMFGGSQEKKNLADILSPLIGPLVDYYRQYLIYHATRTLGGSKTPFLMIFRERAWEELKTELLPILEMHSYIMEEITWENILLRGMKADLRVWKTMGKPANLPMKVWVDIYHILQKLKGSWGIKVADEEQNEARVFKGYWHNLDDPSSLMNFMIERFKSLPGHSMKDNNLWVVFDTSDNPLSQGQIQSSIAGEVAVVGTSGFKGSVHIACENGIAMSAIHRSQNLFYNLCIDEGLHLELPPNHLAVSIAGTIYSIPMQMMTKETLKQQVVNEYQFQEGVSKVVARHRFDSLSQVLAEKEDLAACFLSRLG